MNIICFLVCSSRSRRNVAIAGEGLQNACLCSASMAFEEGGIFIVPHLLWHGALVFVVSSEWPVQCTAFHDKQWENIPVFLPGYPQDTQYVLKQVWLFYSNKLPHSYKEKIKAKWWNRIDDIYGWDGWKFVKMKSRTFSQLAVLQL